MRQLLMLLFVLLLGAACTKTVTKTAPAASSAQVTKNGRLLWQFEALLHDTFGNHRVCALGMWSQKFTSGECSHAVYAGYRYVFANADDSAFHISSKKATNFGNYPQPVLIRGRNIACDAHETTFLIKHVDATGLALGCSRAGVVTGR